MSRRPVGHVTELVRELERWQKRRDKLGLEGRTLVRAIAYLEEYRELLATASGAARRQDDRLTNNR